MILPAFGIISEVLPTFARKPIFGYKMIAFSSLAIAHPRLHGLGAPHVHVSGIAPWLQLPFMIITYRDRHSDRASRSSRGWRRCGAARSTSRRAMLFAHRLHRARSRSAASPASSWPRCRSICTCTARTSSSRTSTTCSSAARSIGVLRRHLLLVPEDDRPPAQRDAGQDPLLAVLDRVQRQRSLPMHWLGLGHAATLCRRTIRQAFPISGTGSSRSRRS